MKPIHIHTSPESLPTQARSVMVLSEPVAECSGATPAEKGNTFSKIDTRDLQEAEEEQSVGKEFVCMGNPDFVAAETQGCV